jgi:DNA-binding beta-propeller fold protein YncE
MEGMKIVEKVAKNAPIPCGNKRCRSADSASTVYCVDCGTFMCERCNIGHEVSAPFEDHTVKTLEEISSLSPEDCQEMFSKNAPPNTCPQHRGKVLEYSCEQCDLLMCQACAIDLKPPHNPKHISTKPNVADRHTQSIKMARQAAVCFGKKCEKIEKKFQSQIRTVDVIKEASLVDIDTAFQTIHEAVEKRKEELRRQVITTAEEKKRTIRSKLVVAEREKETSANAESSLEFLLSSGSSHDVIASKDVVRTHQSVLTSKWCQEELESTVSCMVTFDPREHDAVLKALEVFGVVVDGACPVKCTVEPKPESVQWNGSDPVTLTVTTFDRENIQCMRGGDNVEAFLHPKSPIPGPAIKARVVDDKNGRYTISFPTTYPGECDLYIRVNGRDIRGSPFVVNFLPKSGLPKLNKNVRELGANKGYLNYPQQGGGPWGIAVGQNGHIFATDYNKHQIHVYDKQRKYIRSFGQQGSGNGQLYYPTGIAVDHDNRLYIGSSSNNRIEVVESDGTFVRQIGAGHLSAPYGVTVHNKHVFVAEYGNHRISVFTLDGQLIRTIGSQGSGPGQFSRPSAVAFAPDEDGDMYVADYGNSRIQVFNANGVYQREFGKGQLSNPMDIICTTDHHVLVADYSNSRVVIFNTMGQLIHSFQVGSNPYGLAIDHNGDLLVTLYNTKQVAVF